MDWLDYRDKLKIGFNDERKEQYFFTKVFNFLNFLKVSSENFSIDIDEYINFCDMTGSEIRYNSTYIYDGKERYCDCVSILHDHTANLAEFLSYYIGFINSIKDEKQTMFSKKYFLDFLEGILKESHIQYELFYDGDNVFVFPKGAVEMDTPLVSQPLQWLSNYPKSHTAFVKALKEYSDMDENNASDVADKFRKALETFMQEFFDCDKTLENCKAIYGRYLKDQGVPKEVAANLETLLQAYTTFMNSYAKHHDKTSVNILEYIMYQTGNIIRLLITLKQGENAG